MCTRRRSTWRCFTPGEAEPIEWKLDNRTPAVTKLAKRLKKDYGEGGACCYEAGPTGFALMRALTSLGVACQVIAPALIPKQPGNRVKTDRRDAQKLAALFLAGLLTEVHSPTAKQGAVRDLCRARDDARDERLRAQHRLVKFLLRRGLTYDGATNTDGYKRWHRTLTFEHDPAQATFDHYAGFIWAALMEQAEKQKAVA